MLPTERRIHPADTDAVFRFRVGTRNDWEVILTAGKARLQPLVRLYGPAAVTGELEPRSKNNRPSRCNLNFGVGDLQFDPRRLRRLLKRGVQHHHGIFADLQPAHQAFTLFGADDERQFQPFAFATDACAVGQFSVRRFDKGISVMHADARFVGGTGRKFFLGRRVDVTKFGHRRFRIISKITRVVHR